MRKTELAFLEPPSWPQTWQIQGDRIKVVGRWHFYVKSKTEGGWHCVDLEPVDDYGPGCTCTSYRVRGDCRHMRAIRAHVGLDNRP